MTPEELQKTLRNRLHGTDERTQAELDWLRDAVECVEAMQQENHDLRNRCNVAEGKVQSVAAVVRETYGVADWHRNGTVATWEDVGIEQLLDPGDFPDPSRTESVNP